LCDLLALNYEPHGRRNDDVGVVVGDIDMAWLVESDVVARRP